MVSVDVDLGGDYPVKATVDTGCTWPMSLPNSIADVLLKKALATYAGTTKTTLADGNTETVDVIMINSITVDGRVLQGVEAVVAPSPIAPVLLGLGALNRLGKFNIDNGRIVFTSD
jgi:predicted aspartyl protease